MGKILIGIVAFNPNLQQFLQNLNRFSKVCENIVVVDNHSSNVDNIEAALKGNAPILIKNDKNYGVARALNQIFQYANLNNFDWVLTLDQDSIIDNNLLVEYKKYINLPNVGILSCNILDMDTKKYFGKSVVNITEIDKCITSGSFVSVDAYNKSDKFDEWLFIDSVDFDFCLSLKKHGFKIYQIPYNGLLHKVGNTTYRRFFFKKITILNEKPFRHFYMARNEYYLSRKHMQKNYIIKEFVWEILQRIRIIIYEGKKFEKLSLRKRGIKEAKSFIKQNGGSYNGKK